MHPETELIPYLHGELSAADHDRVAAHVAGCAECRQATEESRAVLQALAARQAGPPPLDWGRYQAEVRERAAGRSQRRWWTRPVPRLAGAGTLTGMLLRRVPGPPRPTGGAPSAPRVAHHQTPPGGQPPPPRGGP